jgi:hypothetical protein
MKNFCIILVFNKKYLEKSYNTIKQIRETGQYNGDIVCIISDDLKDFTNLLYVDNNIIIKHFKEIDRNNIIKLLEKNPIGDGREINKTIQWHKLYCFHNYFKENYKKCLYIDVGMNIFKPLDKIINLNCDDKILAHSDAYPTYVWKLSCQFDNKIFGDLYKELENKYNLNIDYFQSTIMLYDTKIINDNTFDELVKLSTVCINSKTNEQGILNIYFNCILKKWGQITIKDDETYYYDFFERPNLRKNNYIMLKYLKT